ncbi:MAG: hypothetical protein M5U12_12845 [Verrucomicrobia bacterium]|nr:hypothetical protein [Verrucomicrobiota bacterium]
MKETTGRGGEEDALLDALFRVVLREEAFVETDDGIFGWVLVIECGLDGIDVGVAEELEDVVDAKLVNVEMPFAAVELEEAFEEVLEKGV